MTEATDYLKLIATDVRRWEINKGAKKKLDELAEFKRNAGARAAKLSINHALDEGNLEDVAQILQTIGEHDREALDLFLIANLAIDRLKAARRGTNFCPQLLGNDASVEIVQPGVTVCEENDGTTNGSSWSEPRIAALGERFDGSICEFRSLPEQGGYLKIARTFSRVIIDSLIDPVYFTPRITLAIAA